MQLPKNSCTKCPPAANDHNPTAAEGAAAAATAAAGKSRYISVAAFWPNARKKGHGMRESPSSSQQTHSRQQQQQQHTEANRNNNSTGRERTLELQKAGTTATATLEASPLKPGYSQASLSSSSGDSNKQQSQLDQRASFSQTLHSTARNSGL